MQRKIETLVIIVRAESRKPLVLKIPVIIGVMNYGATSRESLVFRKTER